MIIRIWSSSLWSVKKINGIEVEVKYLDVVKCGDQVLEKFIKDNYWPGQFYCANFDESTYLYNNWFKKDFSIYRLDIHRCD